MNISSRIRSWTRWAWGSWCGLMIANALVGQTVSAQLTIFDYNARLGNALNFGNALEAPREGDWGFRLEPWHFEAIAKGGFDSVRVPIRWTSHTGTSAPYTIDQGFLNRIDWVVQQAEKNDLAVIVNMHHYDEIYTNPAGHRARFVEIWKQIAEHFQSAPDSVYFELLNEPNGALSGSTWNSVFAEALTTVRESNPTRPIIVGGDGWNNIAGLSKLSLPANDQNLILTYHYYSPFEFTHQGAEWVDNSNAWLGTDWTNTAAQERAVRRDFDTVKNTATKLGRPVLLGEFGAYSKADMPSRERWTKFIANEAEARDFSWSYWEFGAGFGAYDRTKRQWIEPIYNALSPHSVFDTNGDGNVTRTDFLLLRQKIAASDTTADINHDDAVSNKDAQFWSHFAGYRVGDFDADGEWTADDIDRLSEALRSGTTNPRYDLDNDDKFAPSDRRVWVEKLANTYFGDANLDGVFDSQDLVRVFQTAEFEDGIPNNSSWSDGDWNGDGDFDTTDMVAAFAEGVYEKGPRPALGVPEPNAAGQSLLSSGWLLLAHRRALLRRAAH